MPPVRLRFCAWFPVDFQPFYAEHRKLASTSSKGIRIGTGLLKQRSQPLRLVGRVARPYFDLSAEHVAKACFEWRRQAGRFRPMPGGKQRPFLLFSQQSRSPRLAFGSMVRSGVYRWIPRSHCGASARDSISNVCSWRETRPLFVRGGGYAS